MKIIKFRIRNYKSIIDSRDCYPGDRVTILAGKNEAGKSSILEALEDFQSGRPIREKAVPITGMKEKPQISIEFEVTESEINEVLSAIGRKAPIGVVPEVGRLTLVKTFPNTYSTSGSFVDHLGLDDATQRNAEIQRVYDDLLSSTAKATAAKHNHTWPALNLDDLNATRSLFKQFNQTFMQTLAPHYSPADQAAFTENYPRLIKVIDEARQQPIPAAPLFATEFSKRIPNFILFSSFEDVFPNEIPLAELASNKWIQDLSQMSDIDVAVIRGGERSAKKQHKHQLNVSLNDDFKQFWTQDASHLSVDWDSEKLEFWIEEGGYFFPPEIRSQGRRWHLAFYIRVSARAREDVKNIILIDEPGLHLHAKAQRDILSHLEKTSERSQVIFSTHSPYLIEPEKLDRVRLVQRDANGTQINNKIHSVADKETLTPILTAIGLELNQGIVATEKLNNVIVEGTSDYFYLTAMKHVLQANGYNFVYGGSSGNMPKVGTILLGWGCKVVFLYDDDQAYSDAQRNIRKDWSVFLPEELSKLPIEGAIEDMFSKAEFAKIVDVDEGKITGKNSQYMKGRDKVLAARRFLERARSNSVSLTPETLDRWKKLLDNLSSAFEEAKK